MRRGLYASCGLVQNIGVTIYCPACRQENPDDAATCKTCEGALTFLDGWTLIAAPDDAISALVEVGPLLPALRRDQTRGVVRLGVPGSEARLGAEAAVVRGFRGRGAPEVLDEGTVSGLGAAVVFSVPADATLQAQMDAGLRLDDAKARTLLTALLRRVNEGARLSPPVFHRAIYPDTVCWDGRDKVTLVDYHAATDKTSDGKLKPAAIRDGYAPPQPVTQVKAELFAAAATVVSVLSRMSPSDIPAGRRGRRDVKGVITVSDELEGLLDDLMHPSASSERERNDAASDRELITDALTRLDVSTGQRPSSPPPASVSKATPGTRPVALAAGAAVALAVVGLAVGYMMFTPAPVTSSFVPAEETPVPAPPAPPPPVATKASSSSSSSSSSSRKRRPKKRPPVPADVATSAIQRRGPALTACGRAGVDRVRLRLEFSGDGKLKTASTVERQVPMKDVGACMAKALAGLTLPQGSLAGSTTLQAWVWTAPRLKVRVF